MKLAHRSSVEAFLQHAAMHHQVLNLDDTLPMQLHTSFIYDAYKVYVDQQPQHVKRVEQRMLVKEMKKMGFQGGPVWMDGCTARGFKLPGRKVLEDKLKREKKWDRDQE